MAGREKGMCSSWFEDATQTCLTCKFRMPCSVFENNEDVPGWRAEASVAYCKACFHEKMKRQLEVTGTISERFSGNQGNVYHSAKRRERMNSIGSHILLT